MPESGQWWEEKKIIFLTSKNFENQKANYFKDSKGYNTQKHSSHLSCEYDGGGKVIAVDNETFFKSKMAIEGVQCIGYQMLLNLEFILRPSFMCSTYLRQRMREEINEAAAGLYPGHFN